MTAPSMLALLGVDYRTSPLADREALALDRDGARALLARIVAAGGIQEAAVLSTCSRSELYVVAASVAAAVDGVARARAPFDVAEGGPGAARHLLRVACGIDSPILGDAQVLGQVKEAYAIAREAGAAGPVLHRLFETALRAGKRTRHETGIGHGATSTATAAADLAARGAAPLTVRRVVAARHLAKRGPAAITVVNRTLERAQAIARAIGGDAKPLDALHETLASADVVVSATRSPRAVISSELVAAVMRARPTRPLLALDLAVPRDIDWQAAAVPGVTLQAIDEVQAEVSRRVAERSAHVPRVQAIVDEELGRFGEWLEAMQAADVIRALRTHAERARQQALARWASLAPAADRTRADRATRLEMNRLLHGPTMRLRAMSRQPDGAARLSALRARLHERTRGPNVSSAMIDQ